MVTMVSVHTLMFSLIFWVHKSDKLKCCLKVLSSDHNRVLLNIISTFRRQYSDLIHMS